MRLNSRLCDDERAELLKFIADSRSSGLFLLSEGALEAYLPAGYRSKSLDKLITFLQRETFWEELPQEARTELSLLGPLIVGA